MRRGKHEAKRVRLPLRAYLLYLLVASFLVTGVTFSRYITSSAGGDEARVASMQELSLTENGDFTEDNAYAAHIIPGWDLTKQSRINYGGSEMAAYVFVSLELTGGWARDEGKSHDFSLGQDGISCLSFSVDEQWSALETGEDAFVYYQSVAPNTPLEEADVIAEDGKITVSSLITEAVMNRLPTNITIKIQATAVQSGGFDTAEAAWASVSAQD